MLQSRRLAALLHVPVSLMQLRLLPLLSRAWLPLAALALWWTATHRGWVPALLLPQPETVLARALELAQSGELARHAAVSLGRVLLGFALSATLALCLAVLTHASKGLEAALSLFLGALRVIPPLSLVPLLILWLGIDEASKVAIVVLSTFFPVFLTVRAGFAALEAEYAELRHAFSLTAGQYWRHILLPGVVPALRTGLSIGYGYAWRALVAAELIAAASGLGYLIGDAAVFMHTDTVLVGIFTIALLGVGSQWLLTALVRVLFRRRAWLR